MGFMVIQNKCRTKESEEEFKMIKMIEEPIWLIQDMTTISNRICLICGRINKWCSCKDIILRGEIIEK